MASGSGRSGIGSTPDGLVVSVRPLEAAAHMAPVWRDLGRDCLVENLFYEADFALAAAHAFGAGILVLTVSDRPVEDAGARLLALWPCRIVHRWGLPLPALMGWTHGFSIFGAPLLAQGDAERGLRALLGAPRLLGLPRRLMMPYLPLDGPFASLLDRTLSASGGRRADFWTHERGFLDLSGSEEPIRRHGAAPRVSRRKAKQLARFSRRISVGETVEHETIRAPEALPDALADYVAMETAGWKGRAGTAIGQRPAENEFLHRVVEAYGRNDRLRIDRLRRNSRSLASSIGLETGSTFWFLKISYDEAEAKNSPGALLVERVTRSLFADGRVVRADSCAPPNFPLIETFWKQRRRLAHGLIEAGGGDRFFSIAAMLEHVRAWVGRVRARKHASGKSG